MNPAPDDRIRDPETLRAHYGTPVEHAVKAELDHLDAHHRLFISLSPFLCLAAAGADGQPSVSPKGDAPGFVEVVDERTLLLPDRIGNNKVEGFAHLLENPKVALVFLVPGIREVLRVHGTAEIRRDEALLDRVAARGARPPAVLVIRVAKAYFHCGKALIRSHLWAPESQANAAKFPPFGQVIKAQLGVPEPADVLQAGMEQIYRERLY